MSRPLVEVETTIQAPPRVVWHVMTNNPSTMFMGAKVETDWKPGHPITMSGEFNGKRFEDSGEIQSCSANRELSFTHFSGSGGGPRPGNGNLVTIRLQADGSATTVRLSQAPLDSREITETQMAQFTKNWSAMLNALKSEAEAAANARA